jgi:hypothetical protein
MLLEPLFFEAFSSTHGLVLINYLVLMSNIEPTTTTTTTTTMFFWAQKHQPRDVLLKVN